MDTRALLRLLTQLPGAGDYAVAGTQPLPVVRIDVDGVGTLGLPLPPAQARALAAIATPAPFGRGVDTLVDPAVRRCGQIDAAAVHIHDARWSVTLDAIVKRAVLGLGGPAASQANLYKLLVYQPGDFFLPHRDSEKVPGMYATLVVALPSPHVGGDLHVEHAGETFTAQLGGDDLGVARWCAFHADCRHELRPLEEGHRVVLVYNLVGEGPRPAPIEVRRSVAQIAEGLATLPAPCVVPLEHAYTPAEIAWDTMKARDHVLATALRRAAPAAGCRVTFGWIELRVASSDGYGDDDDAYDDDAYDAEAYDDEACDDDDEDYDDVSVHAVFAGAEPELPLRELVVDEDGILGAGAIRRGRPTSSELREATGNEGATRERRYRRAALCVLPDATLPPALVRANGAGVVALLDGPLGEGLRRELETRASLAHVPNGPWLPALVRHWLLRGDRAGLQRVAHRILGARPLTDARREADPHLLAALELLPRSLGAEVVAALTSTTRPSESLTLLGALPPELVAGANPAPALRGLPPVGRYDAAVRADLLVRLSQLLPAAAAAIAAAVRLNPAAFPLDPVLLPAAERAHEPLRRHLRQLAADQLRPLVPPPVERPITLSRDPKTVACPCALCGDIRSFLADPTRARWSLRAPAPERSHVERSVTAADVTPTTDKRPPAPYTLTLTKNTRSWDLAERRRDEALALLRRLGETVP